MRRLLVACGASVVVVLVLFWASGRNWTVDEAGASREGPSDHSAVNEADEGEKPIEVVLPLPPSLEGTVEDGALVVDADGHFVPTHDAIDLFDYYLSSAGEESEDQIRSRILAAIASRLEGSAASAARQLLNDYLTYRARAAELLGQGLVGEDLERRLQYLRELRREIFGPEIAKQLFGEEEERWFADVARNRIAMDESLEPAERERRLRLLDADLPPNVVANRNAARSHLALRNEEDTKRLEGASGVEIQHMREERFGVEAADRLSALDATRAEWTSRLEAYRVERDRDLADAPIEEHPGLIEAARRRHFGGAELSRARTLDRLEDGTADRN